MTKLSREENRTTALCALLLTLTLASPVTGCYLADTQQYSKKDFAMNSKKMTLWQAIDAAAQQIPLSKAKIENLFSAALTEKKRNKYTVFFEGSGGSLEANLVVEKIDLRQGLEPNDPGFMVLEFSGQCISIAEVRTHYPDLTITGHPRGRSQEEATTHTATLNWGTLSFAFKESKPDCLAWIAFNPNNP